MADRHYDLARDLLLSKFDWPFARRYAKLQEIDFTADPDLIPPDMHVYQLPSDCLTPRDIHPRGSRDNWTIMGRTLLTSDEAVNLYYTALIEDTNIYSQPFIALLATMLAARIAMPITQDKQLAKAMQEQLRIDMLEMWESEANVGNAYREYDEDPNNDTFVNPDLAAYPWIVT